MKPLSDWDDSAKILLAIGGAIIAGTVISIRNAPEETARESLQNDSKLEQDKIKLITVKLESERKPLSVSTKGATSNEYPPEYYKLSKGAQYRYRKSLRSKE